MASPTEPWSVWPTSWLNRDGRSRYLIVCPADGGHVTEDDVEWLRKLIRAWQRPDHQVSLMPIQVVGDTTSEWMVAVCSCGKWSSNKTTSPQDVLRSWAEHKKAKEARSG